MLKEDYFTVSSYKEKLIQWKEECKEWKSFRPFTFSLNNAALLVLDMQNVFLSEKSHAFIPSGKTIIPIINRLVSKFQKYSSPIIFTRHIFPEDENSLMYKIWKHPIRLSEENSELNKELNNTGVILIKRNYSAFKDTNLQVILKKNNIKQVVITGVMSHLCCDTTTRDAFMNGFEPFFVIDGTATYNEKLHLGTIRALTHGFAVPITSEEIINWEEKRKEK